MSYFLFGPPFFQKIEKRRGLIDLDKIMIQEKMSIINYHVICTELQNVIGYQHAWSFFLGS
jgi:hypothetical protein